MKSTRLTARRAAQPRSLSSTKQVGLASLLLITVLALFAGRAQAYSQLIIFGDSLSDTGNVNISTGGIPLPPYFPGRFSNGNVWIETVASNLSLSAAPALAGGTNFAFGGAPTGLPVVGSTPSLIDQLNTIYFPATGGFTDPTALHVIWGGGNDVRAGNVSSSAANIAEIIEDLAMAGATDFLVPNLPDIGLTPEALATPGLSAIATALTLAHNSALDTEIDGLRTSLGVNIIEVDVFAFLNNVIANPALFGITDVSNPCYSGATGVGGPGTVCANPDQYVFWDGIHPTARAHELLGDYATALIPVPAAVWLFGSALGLLGWMRRRAA